MLRQRAASAARKGGRRGGGGLVSDSRFRASLRQPLKAGRGMVIGSEKKSTKEGTLRLSDRGLVRELLRDEGNKIMLSRRRRGRDCWWLECTERIREAEIGRRLWSWWAKTKREGLRRSAYSSSSRHSRCSSNNNSSYQLRPPPRRDHPHHQLRTRGSEV